MSLRAPEEHTCRLCTNTGVNYTPIFNKNEGDVVRMIRCLPVQIRSNDGLPSHICPGCLQALDVSYNLHILCLKANLKLLEKSTTLRTKKLVQKGRTPRKDKKSTEDDSDKDPIILESFHFPEAVYNNQKEFSKIFQKPSAVKLERVDDSASTSSRSDVNHNQVQCKQEPIDFDEPGPSGYQQKAPSPEKMETPGGKSRVKDENGSWGVRTPFRDPQRTCQSCGVTSSVANFRLKRARNNKKRVRADDCLLCEEKNSPADKRRSRRKSNQPCRSIENVQEGDDGDGEDFEGYMNMNVPHEHSYARTCALKNMWKQQVASEKSPPKPKKVKKERTTPKLTHSCLYCGKEHQGASKLKRHIAVHHTSPDQWQYSCDRCGDKFPILEDFKRHQLWNHKDERKFTCDLCPASFLTQHRLKVHKTHRHGIIKKEITDDNPL